MVSDTSAILAPVAPSAESPAVLQEGLYRQCLDALPDHIAVLDAGGRIIFVNKAWRAFACANGCGEESPALSAGVDYLDVCRTAAQNDHDAAAALAGIEGVLTGVLPRFTMEYPCDADGCRYWFLMNVAALVTGNRRGAIVSHVDISATRQAADALLTTEQRFRAMFENAAIGIAEVALDGTWLRVNRRLEQIIGYSASELRTLTWQALTHPADANADLDHMAALRSGAAEFYSMEKRFVQQDGTVVCVQATVNCLRSSDGRLQSFVAMIEDIAERKLAEDRQRILQLELAHRGKNLLAVVQSIVSRSLSNGHSPQDSRDALIGRLQALAQTYGTLTDEVFEGAPLRVLLQDELAMFGGRVTLDGPSVLLSVKASQTFALVIHELATNAAKYGALSAADGRVSVAWSVSEADRQLTFAWRESGGPPAAKPVRTGFGTTLIAGVAAAEFGCKPELCYGGAGFTYRFEAPLSRLEREPLRLNS